jgi:hypothetical protein
MSNIPGIISAVAALITALTGLIPVLIGARNQSGDKSSRPVQRRSRRWTKPVLVFALVLGLASVALFVVPLFGGHHSRNDGLIVRPSLTVSPSATPSPPPSIAPSPSPSPSPTLPPDSKSCAPTTYDGSAAWTCVLGADDEVVFNIGLGTPYVHPTTSDGDVIFQPDQSDAYLYYKNHKPILRATVSACLAPGKTYDIAHRYDLRAGIVACRAEDDDRTVSFVQITNVSKLGAADPQLTVTVFFKTH